MNPLDARRASLLAGAVLGVTLAACSFVTQRPELRPPEQAPAFSSRSPQLKAHMHSGELYLLSAWQVVDSSRALQGSGLHYDVMRVRLDSGAYLLPVDSIALVETNVSDSRFPLGLQVLGFLTVVYGVTAVACLSDPKSCFGSCPTFYVADGRRELLQAEGFSGSVARVLEARDVDPLYGARPAGRHFAITMRNEALETHMVRSVHLHAVRRPLAGRVFASRDGTPYPATLVTSPTACQASEGDCLALVRALDTLERRSPTDSVDLAARETVELEFPAGRGSYGLVLGARHSLLSTFVFYQTLAHMGRRAGEWLALLERLGPERMPQALGLMRTLGGIDISVAARDGSWRAIGTYDEAGPIAGDVQIFPLASAVDGEPLRVRLSMTRGNWRLGYVALAHLTGPAAPIILEPVAVEQQGVADTAALAALTDTGRLLTTFPGDAYRIVFELPADYGAYDLFLESRGYYYEWIRAEWLTEENPAMVVLAMTDPAAALRVMAPSFKQVEPSIEALFWRSRFSREFP